MSKIDAILESVPKEIRTVLKCLSDDTRFAIVLTLLKEGEMSFSELSEVLEVPTNILSHHLKALSQEALVANYYAKRGNTADYSFYDTTTLSRDCVDRMFGIVEPKKSASEALARLLVAGQSYAKGLGTLLEALEDYGGAKEMDSITLLRGEEIVLKLPLKTKEV